MTLLNFANVAIHAIVVYAWGLFPALLAWMSRKPAASPAAFPDDGLPRVAILLSAHNEESHIAERVRNLIAMDYPADRWSAFIGVDGSRDRTAAFARAAAAGQPNIVVFDFPENRGKVSVLKDLAGRVPADYGIIGFTDANTDFEPQALRMLMAPFVDAVVGGVCGKLEFVQHEKGATDENVYWKLENWLKARESALDSCLGANGAIYAIRAGLFWRDIPSNTIIDDFVIGMKVREHGYRMVYEPQAVAFEELAPEVHHEWKRRVRIGAGNFQSIGLCRACLSPSFGVFAWSFWSHKVLRWLTPHLMLAGVVLAAAGTVSDSPVPGMVALACYLAFAVAALFGKAQGGALGAAGKLVRGTHYLLAMQAALFAGFLRFCRGNLEGRWQRTAR